MSIFTLSLFFISFYNSSNYDDKNVFTSHYFSPFFSQQLYEMITTAVELLMITKIYFYKCKHILFQKKK